MLGTRYWVAHGVIERQNECAAEQTAAEERMRLDRGEIRITTGKLGTEIKWQVQSPSIASLYATINWLTHSQAPVVLRFFLSGWFEEFYDSIGATGQRIEEIISRGDRHFPIKTFVEEVEPTALKKESLLREIFDLNLPSVEYSVDCVHNSVVDRFDVARIGSKSPIAKFYGTFLTSFPCTGTSYSDRVSAGYRQVLSSGKPRTDHVLAAFRLPNNQVHWVPYHRLILPNAKDTVNVISQIQPVDFKVI